MELDLPDSEIGYVMTAMGENDNAPLDCEFRIRSRTSVDQHGKLVEVGDSATVNDLGRLIVHATVTPHEMIDDWKPETGVVAWVRCGKASAGFVMFRKVIETLRMWGG